MKELLLLSVCHIWPDDRALLSDGVEHSGIVCPFVSDKYRSLQKIEPFFSELVQNCRHLRQQSILSRHDIESDNETIFLQFISFII